MIAYAVHLNKKKKFSFLPGSNKSFQLLRVYLIRVRVGSNPVEVCPLVRLGRHWNQVGTVVRGSVRLKTLHLLECSVFCEATEETKITVLPKLDIFFHNFDKSQQQQQPLSLLLMGRFRSTSASDRLMAKFSPLLVTLTALSSRDPSGCCIMSISHVSAMCMQTTDPFAAMLTRACISFILPVALVTILG